MWILGAKSFGAAKSLCSADPSRTSGLRAPVEVHCLAKAFPESERPVCRTVHGSTRLMALTQPNRF